MKPYATILRFIALSKQLGLLDYWQRSGHWADFASNRGCLANCKAEGRAPG
jgi:hypothetical protein